VCLLKDSEESFGDYKRFLTPDALAASKATVSEHCRCMYENSKECFSTSHICSRQHKAMN